MISCVYTYIRSFVRSLISNSYVEIFMYMWMEIIQHISVIISKWILYHVFGLIASKSRGAKDFDHWIRHVVRTLKKSMFSFFFPLSLSLSLSFFLIGFPSTSQFFNDCKTWTWAAAPLCYILFWIYARKYRRAPFLPLWHFTLYKWMNEWMNGKRITS